MGSSFCSKEGESASSDPRSKCGRQQRQHHLENKRPVVSSSQKENETLVKRSSPVCCWSDASKTDKAINENTKKDISQTQNENKSGLLPSHRPQVIGYKSSQSSIAIKHEGHSDKKSHVIDHAVTTLSKTADKSQEEVSVGQKALRGENNNASQVKPDIQVSSDSHNPTTLLKEGSHSFGNASSPAIISLTSKCKDLSAYKRDYFVPSSSDQRPFQESLNSVEEKVIKLEIFPLFD